MATLSRLSAYHIDDDILRGHFYREVQDYIENDKDAELTEYIIKPDECYRRDLISYRIYGTIEAEWLIRLVTESYDDAEELTAGETIYVPTATWIRRTMVEFMDAVGES